MKTACGPNRYVDVKSMSLDTKVELFVCLDKCLQMNFNLRDRIYLKGANILNKTIQYRVHNTRK